MRGAVFLEAAGYGPYPCQDDRDCNRGGKLIRTKIGSACVRFSPIPTDPYASCSPAKPTRATSSARTSWAGSSATPAATTSPARPVPRRMREASGTSGMKAAANGGLNLSIGDGWWPGAFDGTNGWRIGDEREYAEQSLQDQLDGASLYSAGAGTAPTIPCLSPLERARRHANLPDPRPRGWNHRRSSRTSRRPYSRGPR